MNHFKHIFGKNIPRRAPANALSYYGQHTDIYFENRQFARGSQLSKFNPLSVTKTNHGVGMKYSGQFRQDELRLVSKGSRTIFKQRSRTKSSVISLKKKSSIDKKLGNIARVPYPYSMHQNTKFKTTLISRRHMSQSVATRNTVKNVSHNSSSITFAEKHPRSYAEIIADYSKALYKESTSMQNDSLYFNNIIRQSSFGTSSTTPWSKKPVSAAEHDGIPIERRENHSTFLTDDFITSDRRHRQESITERHHFRHYDTCAHEIMNRSSNEDQSYEKLVADCSKSIPISLASTTNPGLTSSRNVLTRKSVELFGTSTRNASNTITRDTLQKTIPAVATMPLGGAVKEQTPDSRENDWLREIESVISELRSATERKTARAVNVSKPRESTVLQSADASSNALDRIQKLAELIKAHRQKGKDAMERKLDKPKYFSNTAKTLPSRKNLTQTPTSVSGIASALKQPQVELRMIPSEKESIVSINVDSPSIGLSQDPAAKQLSVVVRSDRKEERKPSETQWNTSTFHGGIKSASQRNDFGPMCISISEESAPVKQIEFSINGKPVSELKSVTARTERLDVVSSVDKIEIRIPFAKDDASSKTRRGELSKPTDLSGGQILNVQIAANFQNESGKDSGERSMGTINTTSTSSQIPKTHHTGFNDPVRTKTLSSDSVQQHASSTWPNIRSDNTIEGDINEHETSDNVNLKIQRATTKLSADKTMADGSLIKKATDIQDGRWNIKKTANTAFAETNKYDKNESSDPRVPSKVIPWWSSSDSFSKIRKKDDDRKPVAPTLSRNEKNTISNLNEDLVTESLPSKAKETSSSKSQTRGATTNNSNDLISYSVDSVEQYGIPKRSVPYPCPLKSNRENPSDDPETRRTDLKTENNRILDTRKNNKNFSVIKHKNPVTATTLNTTDEQDKHDVSIDEKISISPKNVETSSRQNSPLKTQAQHLLEQKPATDDASNMKSKIENIVDALKPIKKKEDDTLIDYGLKISSRKSIAKLNRELDKSQDEINENRKKRDLIINQSDEIPENKLNKIKCDINATKTIPRQQIDKRISARQIEVDETKKAEIKLLKLKDLTMRKTTITNIKRQDKNDVKTVHDNDTQPIRSMPALKKDKSDRLSSIKNSSSKSKQLGTSIKTPSEVSKQDEQKNMSSIRNIPRTKMEESKENLKVTSLKSTENHRPSKELSGKKLIEPTKFNIDKFASTGKPSVAQTKSNSPSESSRSKDSKLDKNVGATSNKKDYMTEDMTITQTSKISLPKSSEDDHLHKSKSSRSNKNSSSSSASQDSPKKTDDSTDSKSSDPKMCAASKRQRPIGLYTEQTLNQILEMSQNGNNVDSISERIPSFIGNAGSTMDRSEKRELYSAWLQQSKPDKDNNEKLF